MLRVPKQENGIISYAKDGQKAFSDVLEANFHLSRSTGLKNLNSLVQLVSVRKGAPRIFAAIV
jgi:hypothetical protein